VKVDLGRPECGGTTVVDKTSKKKKKGEEPWRFTVMGLGWVQ